MSDLLSKVEAMRQQAISRAEENRRQMPTVAAWVDAVKSVFPDATVAYASENGITRGTKLTGGIKLSETLVGPWNKPKGTK